MDLLDHVFNALVDLMRLCVLHVGWSCEQIVSLVEDDLSHVYLLDVISKSFGNINSITVRPLLPFLT